MPILYDGRLYPSAYRITADELAEALGDSLSSTVLALAVMLEVGTVSFIIASLSYDFHTSYFKVAYGDGWYWITHCDKDGNVLK
jgi:hypothetical protein